MAEGAVRLHAKSNIKRGPSCEAACASMITLRSAGKRLLRTVDLRLAPCFFSAGQVSRGPPITVGVPVCHFSSTNTRSYQATRAKGHPGQADLALVVHRSRGMHASNAGNSTSVHAMLQKSSIESSRPKCTHEE